MRTILKQYGAHIEVWRGSVQVATIYPTPCGITIHAQELDLKDVDIDQPTKTLHVELRRS
jgi:hypothetical protein